MIIYSSLKSFIKQKCQISFNILSVLICCLSLFYIAVNVFGIWTVNKKKQTIVKVSTWALENCDQDSSGHLTILWRFISKWTTWEQTDQPVIKKITWSHNLKQHSLIIIITFDLSITIQHTHCVKILNQNVWLSFTLILALEVFYIFLTLLTSFSQSIWPSTCL